jgi:hypothetical protein
MYAYGYKNLAHAQETLATVDLSRIPCQDCDTCKIECAMDFDLKNKIMDISRLKDVPAEFFV